MSKKSIIILVIIILILLIGIGTLIYFYNKGIIPGVEIDEKTKMEKIEKTINSLVDDMDGLSKEQIQKRLNTLDSYLPFSYQLLTNYSPVEYMKMDFASSEGIKFLIAKKLLLKADYENDNDFKKSVENFIFSDFYSRNLNNTSDFTSLYAYNYYLELREICKHNLFDNPDKLNFDKSLIGTIDVPDFNPDYMACLATFDNKICDTLQGDQISLKGTSPPISNKDLCQLRVGENLRYYFFFLSKLSCDEIEFEKIDKNCENFDCTNFCKVARREEKDLTKFSTNITSLAELQLLAYINKNIKLCEITDSNFDLKTENISDCKRNVSLWLAIENKNLDEDSKIGQTESEGHNQIIFAEYLIENLAILEEDLDNQIINKTYNFNLSQAQDLKNFCKSQFESEAENCRNTLSGLQTWFKNLNSSNTIDYVE